MSLPPARSLFVAFIIIGLAACAPLALPTPGSPAGNNAPPSIVDTHWNLIGYGQPEALTQPITDTLATLDVDAENFGGTTGCNHYSFNYTASGATLTFAEPGPMMTLMACPDPLMQQETDFLKVMSAVTSYSIQDNQLTLTGPEGVAVFETAQPLALENTEWHLSGLAQNDAIVNTWLDEKITLTLSAGQVTGSAGCNSYFGGYEMTEGTLKFGVLGSTRMACEEEVNQREMEFLTALGQAARFQITRNTLTLLDGDGKLVMQLTTPLK